VQAGIINDEIKRQRKLHPDIPVYAVVEDVRCLRRLLHRCRWIKFMWIKPVSSALLVSRWDGFGFTGAMEKFGVERRRTTAGENKAMLDPFLQLT
jgi:protease-4